ncbi:Xaa-Pro peptidase family protein [Devosia sp. ZB163]|uniref:M24 family metallopeptidase n=1 Tax=Devosia sp. ZB163 TaxID=3025938 RepID=UPI00236090A9|nr:Xaa-Pro peptidase family protein [Devosia sp. ZB163]MDC9824204.1 Xaa-Pro peptidase family protein [Devosia sp. ZB163]
MTVDTKARLAGLRERMKAQDVDLVALAPSPHMDWLVGFHPLLCERPCLLLVGPEREAFLMPALNADGSREETEIPFRVWADDVGPKAAFLEALADVGGTTARHVAFDETMRIDFAMLLLDALPEAKRSFTDDTLSYLRMRKDAREYAALKKNALIADKAMQKGFAAMRPGMTEKELAAIIFDEFSAQGAKPEFAVIAAGPNGAFPHHHTGDRQLAEGDAVVMDIGGRIAGFPSDITRMAVVGRPPDGYGQIHTIVERAVQAALKAAKPGALARDVDEAARKVITDAGYGEYFVHRTGHGMGIGGHEPPYITATSDTVLAEGMVFSIEPGIYIPGRFGIRLEDIVILREDGPEILSSLSRDMHVAAD